jgi:hypothetical protein
MTREDGRMERPIAFNGEMVRAILDGRKTQTRLPLKQQPGGVSVFDSTELEWVCSSDGVWCNGHGYQAKCPYGKPGDLLWVQEDCILWNHPKRGFEWAESGPVYMDDTEVEAVLRDMNNPHVDAVAGEIGWWKKVHHSKMPRWASRILLEVTVVVAPNFVQDISDEDAMAEGVDDDAAMAMPCADGHRMEFSRLWDSIYADQPGRSWADNPWVWVVEFKRVELNQVSGCSDGES